MFKQYIIYCQLDQFDCINKIPNKISHFLVMKMLFHLIIHATLTSYYSISAIKCYNCTDGPHSGPGVVNDFCSNQANSDSWKIIDCAGRCVWKFEAYSTIGLREIDTRHCNPRLVYLLPNFWRSFLCFQRFFSEKYILLYG